MASIITKKGRYYIQYWLSGKRKTIKTMLDATKDNYSKAELMKNRIQERVEIKQSDMRFRDIFNNVEQKRNDKNISIDKAVDIFKLKLALTSKSFQRRFEVSMSYFYQIVSKELKINKVSFEHSLLFVKLLKDKNLSNASIRTYYEHVKMMFQFLVKNKYLSSSPLNTDVLPKKTRKAIITFSKEMLDNILAAARESSEKNSDPRFYDILMLLLLTGLRPKDLLKIRAGDINFAEKTIYIHITKTDKEMFIPMSKSLYNYISNEMKYIMDLDGDGYIFPGYSVSRVGRRFRRIKERLQIKERNTFTLKTFRKSFATYYAKALDIQDVAFLLGHSEISTTLGYYSKIQLENVRSKMDKFDESNSIS